GPALALVAFALALGTFMQVLDSTIANVSLPTIAGNLGVSSDNSTWVVTAFAVAKLGRPGPHLPDLATIDALAAQVTISGAGITGPHRVGEDA
ncbi:hypothetical protein QCE92_14230, partial [Staphylococcus aureus]|nr:hypothetical protein [Staphylococcus aureus]